ncbi:MAG: hypothetical protein V7K50_09915 [Nostoc sp.]|uniref:hypothetical protein n=1 Tax=Nostoc sp. TaxID=1180 RepID=UPI002FF539C4
MAQPLQELYWALGTCTEFRHFGYAQCIATLKYRVRVASRREAVGAASPRVVLGIAYSPLASSSPSSPSSHHFLTCGKIEIRSHRT